MKNANTISHPSEVEHSAEDPYDVITVEADDARPGWVLVAVGTEDEHLGSVYLTAHQARSFANALIHYAAEVSS